MKNSIEGLEDKMGEMLKKEQKAKEIQNWRKKD